MLWFISRSYGPYLGREPGDWAVRVNMDIKVHKNCEVNVETLQVTEIESYTESQYVLIYGGAAGSWPPVQ